MRRAGWIAGGVAATSLVVGAVIGLVHVSKRAAEQSAMRFAARCEAAGFAPRECAFLAELDRRTSSAADDGAMAGVQAANASIQALTRSRP